MFISPCTLRSTQCAALIALATVAGMARGEANSEPRGSNAVARSITDTELGTSLSAPGFRIAPTCSGRWLQPAATLALWLLSADRPDGSQAVATPPETPPTAPHLSGDQLGSSAVHHPESIVAGGSHAHLIPFAVGPPPSRPSPNSRANGTAVPTVDVTRRLFVVPVAHFSARFFPRLACRSFSRRHLVGPIFRPSLALRGAPGTGLESIPSRPSLGWDDPTVTGLFSP